VKVKAARLWSELPVGTEIVFRTDQRDFHYRVEGGDWRRRTLYVSLHRPPRIRRENTVLLNIHLWMRRGQILIKRKART